MLPYSLCSFNCRTPCGEKTIMYKKSHRDDLYSQSFVRTTDVEKGEGQGEVGFCVSWCLCSENFRSCGKKQNVCYGTINATKALRLKDSRRGVFHIFPSVDAWNIDGVTENRLSFH